MRSLFLLLLLYCTNSLVAQKEMNAGMPVPNKDFDREKRMIWGVHPSKKN